MDYLNRLDMNTLAINQKDNNVDNMLSTNKFFSAVLIGIKEIRKNIRLVFTTVKGESPVLFWVAMFCLVLALGCLPGLAIDDRMLKGCQRLVETIEVFDFHFYLYDDGRIFGYNLSIFQT